MSEKRQIGLLITGGTIVSVGKDRCDLCSYSDTKRQLTSEELLRRLPEIQAVAQIHDIPFKRLPSQAFVDTDWLDLMRTLQQILDDQRIDGVVVTLGTNALEETAYFLTLTLKTEKPVVLVGSIRPASALSPDGDLNLLNAVRVAAHAESCGQGVLVVLNETIFAARDVSKTITYRVQTFQAHDLGPLGYADSDGHILYYHTSRRLHTYKTEFAVSTHMTLPRVDIVQSYIGANETMINALVAGGTQGIVSAGAGAGQPTPYELDALISAQKQGITVCQSSRVGSGRVVQSTSLDKRGFIAADNLSPWKARILLSLALTVTRQSVEIQRMFEMY